MKLTKIALATALTTAATSGMALESMDDAAMGAVTGKDGITIELSTDFSGNIDIYDRDGGSGTLANNTGVIRFEGFGLSDGAGGAAAVTLDIDAGYEAADNTAGVLEVALTLGAGTTITTGDLRVGTSAANAEGTFDAANFSDVILNSMDISFASGVTANIQLGNEVQGSMILLTSANIGDLVISNFALNDTGGAVTGGAIGASSITLKELDLSGTAIDVATDGLVITTGAASSIGDIQIVDLYLGDAAAGNTIGDVVISGLDISNDTIKISGH